MSRLDIDQVDRDGAIRESAERASGSSRGDFMALATRGAGALFGAGALLAALPAGASAASTNDVAILNFALTLEFLERDFYAEALRRGGAGRGAQRRFTEVVHQHEAAHVAALQKVLGSSAIAEPTFDFGETTSKPALFRATAIKLEDTGVRAYKGQAPLIQADAILAAALSIHSVEADHAAWIRFIAGEVPTYTGAFEQPLTKAQVLAAVDQTGFIVSP